MIDEDTDLHEPPDPTGRRIADLPTYHQELGRLRMGLKVPVLRDGKQVLRDGRPVMRPAKLTRWRATSQDEARIRRLAELYQGEVEPWADAPEGEQWQVTTSAGWLACMVPPERAYTQANELWSGGGCVRRCDGVTDTISGGPCVCLTEQEINQDDPKPWPCKLTTRLSVVLPDVPGVGVWRVETHGFWSGSGIKNFARNYLPYLKPFQPLQLRIVVKQRQVDGKTYRFPVVEINSDKSMGDLLAAGVGYQLAAPPAPIGQIADREHARRAGADPDTGEQVGEGPVPASEYQGWDHPGSDGEGADDPWYAGGPPPPAPADEAPGWGAPTDPSGSRPDDGGQPPGGEADRARRRPVGASDPPTPPGVGSEASTSTDDRRPGRRGRE